MSLDFNLTNLDPAKRAEVFPPDAQGKMNDALHILIFITMAVDIGDITDKNVNEFWTRVWLWQKIVGSGFNKAVQVREPQGICAASDTPHVKDTGPGPCVDWKQTDDGLEWQPFLLERRHIEAAIGLHTNVGKTTSAQFMTKVYEVAERFAKMEAES